MKKTVIGVFCILLCASVCAYQLESLPAEFDLTVPAGSCDVQPLTLLVSEESHLDFSVSRNLEPYVHVTRIDATHFHVYFHPTEEVTGTTLNGNLYVSARPALSALTAPLGRVMQPIEITMDITEKTGVFESTCPVLGPSVRVVPLSLDAVSLLILVLVSLGIVNVSSRLKVRQQWKK